MARTQKELKVILGYARVSKGEDQNTKSQMLALKNAGAKKIFEETASGGRWDRPELHRMLDQLREGDVVTVWKLDRLTRSLKDLLHIMEIIKNAGAGFKSLTENIDTTTPAGLMMMQMIGSFAEFERAMIRERTRAGLETARKEGRIGGRRPKLTSAQVNETLRMIKSGEKTASDIARLFRVHRTTISRLLLKYNLDEFKKSASEETTLDKKSQKKSNILPKKKNVKKEQVCLGK
jgi:DNA invertase Pin-like site-specific DNA recombinase